MAVHLPAFVVVRQGRKGVGCLETEFLGESGFHVLDER